jgi:hypothetical protein
MDQRQQETEVSQEGSEAQAVHSEKQPFLNPIPQIRQLQRARYPQKDLQMDHYCPLLELVMKNSVLAGHRQAKPRDLVRKRTLEVMLAEKQTIHRRPDV